MREYFTGISSRMNTDPLFLKHMNIDNPLGHKGLVASEFG